MHASITAKSYETRLLTQLVRLPVPSWTQLVPWQTGDSGGSGLEVSGGILCPS